MADILLFYYHFAILLLYAVTALGAAARSSWRVRLRPALWGILVLQLVEIAFRWALSGHPPIFGVFEETLAAAFFVTLISLLVDKKCEYYGFTVPLSALTLLYGIFYDMSIKPLVISEQSLWVYFHALFAWVSYGFYTLAFCSALWVLLKKETSSMALFRKWLVEYGILYGFAAQTLYFFLGSYYSSLLHGHWWQWDMVEYLFIISWFLYAIVIHGRIFFHWDEQKVAKWNVAAFLANITLYWGLIFIPWTTYHIFELGLKRHF
ncbi:MAG: cytochrome c biogenesis protein [Deltaproteobacteria bacterium]|nr:cytochrome c biogenesis protein [Deltaproteobacteria bacterium]